MDWQLIAAPFVILFRFLVGILKSRIGVMLVIVLAVVIFVSTRPGTAAQKVEPYNANLPTIKQAPTMVQTTSRIYYVKNYTDDGKVLTMTLFYTYDKDRWTKNTIPLPIDRGIYGEVRVTKRGD